MIFVIFIHDKNSRAVKKRSSGEAEKQSYDNTIFILFSSIGLTLTFSLLSLIPGNFHFPLQFPIPPLPNLYSLKLNPNFSVVLDTLLSWTTISKVSYRHAPQLWKNDKCRREGKGRRCCLGFRIHSIPCRTIFQ